MTLRAVLIGLVGVVALSLFTPYSDLVLRGTWLGLTAFPISAFCAFFLLLVLNAPLRRAGRGLSRGELLVAYAMLLAAAGVSSFGLTGLLVPYAAGPHYFATPENHYTETILKYLPRWLLLPESVSTALYEGLPPGRGVPWTVWLRPAVGWGILIAGVYLGLIAIASAVRRPWVEDERLVFPLVQLPLELAAYDDQRQGWPSYFRNPLVWGFAAVPFLFHGINGLHHYIPAVPAINLHRIDLGGLMTGRLAEAVRPFWLRLLFTVIGLAYLLPSDVGFSLWFCYFLFLAQQMLGARLGYTMPFVQAFPVRRFVALQMIGGVLVVGIHLLRTGWPHLRELLAGRLKGEALGPRALPAMLLLSAGLLAVWGELVGVGAGWVLLLFGLFYLFQLVATRLVAEGGMLYVQHPYRPLNLVLSITGTAGPGPSRLPALALLDHLWMLDNRSPLQPAVLQGLKLGDAAGLRLRSLLAVMTGAVALAVPLSLYAYLRLMLREGGLALNPWFTSYYTNNLFGSWSAHLVLHGEPARPLELAWVGLGGVSMTALLLLHHRFWRWPLNPIGYLMGASWPMINFWFSVFCGWLFKTCALKYGGARLYKRLLPGFLALILAEYLSAGLWVVIDALAGVRGHEIFTF